MLNRIKEQFERGGGGNVAWHLLLACLFAHEYDEAGSAQGYFNLQMSHQVSTIAALVYFQGWAAVNSPVRLISSLSPLHSTRWCPIIHCIPSRLSLMPFYESNDNCDHCRSSGNWPAAVVVKYFLCLAGCKAASSSIHPACLDIQMICYSKEDALCLVPKGPAERSSLGRTDIKLSRALRLITSLLLSSWHLAVISLNQVYRQSIMVCWSEEGQPCEVFAADSGEQ